MTKAMRAEVSDAARLAERGPPAGPAVMYQDWRELLFLHWAVDPDLVAATLPPGLSVDTFEGRAWIGVVPFFMRRVRPRFCPPVPGISNFLELNLRTYAVDARGRPGVWFYSLETSHRLPVAVARTFVHLNYRWARMAGTAKDGVCRYGAERRLRGGWDAPQQFAWCRSGPAAEVAPGSLAFFLVERYRLFAWSARKRRLYSGRVRHAPYPVGNADVKAWSGRLFSLNGFAAPGRPPDSVLASAGVRVSVHPLERLTVG
mgnify:CR=1 FL=1